MGDIQSAVMIVLILIGGTVFVIGFLITFKNKTMLIAGSREQIEKHGRKLRYWVGINTLILGGLIISLSFLDTLSLSDYNIMPLFF